jgi:hypothetical protein
MRARVSLQPLKLNCHPFIKRSKALENNPYIVSFGFLSTHSGVIGPPATRRSGFRHLI